MKRNNFNSVLTFWQLFHKRCEGNMSCKNILCYSPCISVFYLQWSCDITWMFIVCVLYVTHPYNMSYDTLLHEWDDTINSFYIFLALRLTCMLIWEAFANMWTQVLHLSLTTYIKMKSTGLVGLALQNSFYKFTQWRSITKWNLSNKCRKQMLL